MRVLFVNHLEHACGVYQLFKHLTTPVIASNEDYYYIETNHEWEHDHWIGILQPEIVIYNFYFSGVTMPWLSSSKIASQRGKFKQLCLFHEGNIDDKGFDLILHQDPTNEDSRYYNLPRPIPEYTNTAIVRNTIPHIGTFGFGLGGKGFTRVVEQVIAEFETAIIRMNIPFAHFGDIQGNGARSWASACQAIAAKKPGIELYITHTLLPEPELLDFLAINDVNCFFYDENIGRGISGTLDYALAVRKPIAITKSWQFKHMWNDNILIERNTLRGIIQQGITPLQEYHEKWNNTTLINAFNTAFEKVQGRHHGL